MFTSYSVIALRHHQWIDNMGWHKASPLESLGLIASEISETLAELIPSSTHLNDWSPTPSFTEELADIALRAFDLMQSHNPHTPYDLLMATASHSATPHSSTPLVVSLSGGTPPDLSKDRADRLRGTFPIQPLLDLTIALGPWINSARTRQHLPPEFLTHGQIFIQQIQKAATTYNIDLFNAMSAKIEKNLHRGHRNRTL